MDCRSPENRDYCRKDWEYTQLAKDHLKKFPIENAEDFDKLREGLEDILQNRTTTNLPEPLKGRVDSIRDLLDPKMQYCPPKEYEQFKAVVMDRIAAKVKKIANMSPLQKEKYIKKQQQNGEIVKENRRAIAQVPPPEEGSERNTIPDPDGSEWVRVLQERFQREGLGIPAGHQERGELPSMTRSMRIFSLIQRVMQEALVRDSEQLIQGLERRNIIALRDILGAGPFQRVQNYEMEIWNTGTQRGCATDCGAGFIGRGGAKKAQ